MMTTEDKINIIMKDGCTRNEAEKHLANYAIVFEASDMPEFIHDFEDADYIDEISEMYRTGKPAPDWGVVNTDGKTYYIMYVL